MFNEPNNTQLLLARLFGGVYFGASFSWFRTRDTRDATVQITLMTSRVVVSIASNDVVIAMYGS